MPQRWPGCHQGTSVRSAGGGVAVVKAHAAGISEKCQDSRRLLDQGSGMVEMGDGDSTKGREDAKGSDQSTLPALLAPSGIPYGVGGAQTLHSPSLLTVSRFGKGGKAMCE